MSSNGSFRAPPIEDLQPHFPQYKIEAFAAVGGMGAVYRATQISVDRPVALKILPPEMAIEESFRERFAMEAKAMARLSHRNLVQLYDFGETGGIFWMIQEWVEGRTIFEVMHEEERLDPREAAALVAQACEGLGYAHKQGIVHRDVKPANMMVDDEGILKLMDFGLAGIGGVEGMQTQGGGRFATEEYAAPELWDLSTKIDHRVDIFALGVLLYEALTGERPTGTFRMPSELRRGLDTRFDAIVVRALQRERENRYASCAELLTALRGVVTDSPKVKLRTPPPPPRVVVPKSPEGAVRQVTPSVPLLKKMSAKGLIVVSTLLLLGLLGGVWMIFAGGKKKDDNLGGSEASLEEDGEGGTNESRLAGVDRLVREQAERVAREARTPLPDPPDPAPPPLPTPTPPAPTPTPSPVAIGAVLKVLDDELRTNVGEPFKTYMEVREDLEEKYLTECSKEEDNSVQAGDLDAVLFWQDEIRVIKEGGDAPVDDAGVPARAITLRRAWRTRMDPLKAALAPLQSAYLEKCGELARAADGEAARILLQKRKQMVAEFPNFIALCGGHAPPFLENPFEIDEAIVVVGKVAIGGTLASRDADLMAGRLSNLPEGTKSYEGNYYLLVPGPLNWQSAKAWCEARGGHLATLAHQDEWEWFSENLGGEDVLAHLGAQLQGGEWVWITGESWAGTPRWATGQPNNSGGNQNVLGWDYNGFNDLSQAPVAFAMEWEGKVLGQDLLARTEGLLPAQMVGAYKAAIARLAQLEQAGDTAELTNAIKVYGRSLVRDEKELTRQREIKAARVLRLIKNEMLARLEGIAGAAQPDPGPRPPPRGKLERVVLVERGNSTEHCEFDRKLWKRKGRALLTEGVDKDDGIYPIFACTPSIGRGDFRINMKLTKGQIGATSLQLWLGETCLHLDSEDGSIMLQRCGASIKRVRGANLGALAEAGAPMEIVLERMGTGLQLFINGKQGLQTSIHDRELGQIVLHPGTSRLEIYDLVLDGTIDIDPEMTILGEGGHGWSKGITQLVPTGNGGLTALFITNEDRTAIWARRSRDSGKKWTNVYPVIAKDEFQADLSSFAAACDTRRDQLFMVVATGQANERLFLTIGRNGGRNWSKPVNITTMAKEGGWNVQLGGQGLIVTRGKEHPGRIVLPMLSGAEGRSLYLLISDDNGRQWKRIGPLAGETNKGPELMEDAEGVLWVATGPQSGEGKFRMVRSSKDGGDTWSEPTMSSMQDANTRGSLALGQDASDQPVWYYASSGVVTDENGGIFRTHLTLFGSRDEGKTWTELRRMHFGAWSYPTVVPLGPNRCGISFRRNSYVSNKQEIRFVVAGDLWGK